MPNSSLNSYSDHLLGVFGKPAVALKSGYGSIVEDFEGKKFIDLLGGIAVNCLGHSNLEIAQTISEQAQTLMHTSNFFTNEKIIQLAEKLKSISKCENGKVFFTNSGTEANEAALKLAKKHANTDYFKKYDKPARIIALTNAFHGRSLGALSLTHKLAYREPFFPLIENVEFIEANSVDALNDSFSQLAYSKKGPVAALFLEVIQGEAGVKELSAQFLARANHLAKENNALLIVDEVQTGMGRTGKWFAHLNDLLTASTTLTPDVITVAKALGNGFPIGAMIVRDEKTAQILAPGEHGTTFGGNPLAAAVAKKVIEIIERDDLLSRASDISRIVAQKVLEFKNSEIKEVRGAGALIAIELKEDNAKDVYEEALKRGLIVNAVNPNSIRLAPAYNIDENTLIEGLQILNDSILSLKK